MNLQDAIAMIESVPGFTDETTLVGEAWTTVIASLLPTPIPIAERLPGPEDCDAEGRCWVWWKNGVRWVLDEWTHRELLDGPLSECVSHWLPATALPIPAGEVE